MKTGRKTMIESKVSGEENSPLPQALGCAQGGPPSRSAGAPRDQARARQRVSRSRPPMALGVVLLVMLATGAQGQLGFFSQQTIIKKAVAPIFLEGQGEPVVVLHIGKIFTDYERRGFFRIGLLPVAVMEEVTCELRQPDQVTNALAKAHHWLAPALAGRRMELRKLSVVLPQETTPRLQAARVHLAENGQWELLDEVCFQSASGPVRTPRARLHVIGPAAGQVTWVVANATNVCQLFLPRTATPAFSKTMESK